MMGPVGRTLARAFQRVSAAAVLTLTLGLAANVAVFAVAHRLLAAPPDLVANPASVFTVRAQSVDQPGGRVTERMYDALREAPLKTADVSTSIQLWGNARARATAVRASIVYVDDNYFDLLGALPAAGHVFAARGSRAGGVASVVSGRLITRMGIDDVGVGGSLWINGVWTTIVGVMPRRFNGLDPRPGDVWIRLRDFQQVTGPRSATAASDDHLLGLIGRLRPGETPAAAASELSVRLGSGYRAVLEDVVGIQTGDRSGFFAMSAIMQTAVALLAVIAIVNAAGVTLAQYLARQREFAVRLALGSTRAQLIRALVRDAMMLAILTLVLALPASAALVHVFGTYLVPEQLSGLFADAGLSTPVLLLAVVLAVVTSAITVLIPGVRIARASSVGVLARLQTPISGLSGSRRRLVVLQTSLAVTLVATMGLLLQTIHKIVATPSGLNVDNTYFAKIEPRSLGYSTEKSMQLTRQLPAALAARPELAAWAIARQPPLQSYGAGTRVVPEKITAVESFARLVGYNVVSSNYFDFLGLPTVVGRSFDATNSDGSSLVVVVNETMARKWGTPDDAIGARIRLDGESSPRTVIGVVKDAKYVGLMQPAMPYFYLPMAQDHPLAALELTLLIRPAATPHLGEVALASAVGTIDPELAVFGFSSMERQMSREVAFQTLLAGFVSVVGGLALLLVCLGLHAGLAQTMMQTRRTMAVRLALGATPKRLQLALIGRVLVDMALGAAIGMGIAFVAKAALGNILVTPTLADARIVGLAFGTVVICAFSGAAIHLWRVGRLHPSELLREP